MNLAFNSHSLFMLVCRSDAGSDSNEAVERGAMAVKLWRVEQRLYCTGG